MNWRCPERVRRVLYRLATVIGVGLSLGHGLVVAAPAVEAPSPRYVGAAVCAGCHAEQAADWQRSDHAKSMQPVRPETVLGNFNDAIFTHQGVTSRFSRRDGRYFVRTDGPDGKMREYPIAYTFGHFPLQQYLIEIPGGRLQALGIAWDSRPAAAGGQRWFHLYPESKLKPGEPVHWSGRDQNWNFMCASCHSTELKKNFDLAKNRFSTAWSDLNVACEACHGPGSIHASRAVNRRPGEKEGSGLVVDLHRSRDLAWRFATPESKIAAPVGRVESARAEADSCFPCHARRQELGTPRPGKPFLDNYLPTLVEKGVYHADGQIDGEAFEYGSFAQSRMYRAGVSCGNCHQPHSLKLKAEGNKLCNQCHQAAHYDQPGHHRHAANSEGARCIACHMPAKTYMGVDVRRDHGFRLPDPARAAASGSPDACAQCHAERPAGWAAKALGNWGVKARAEKSQPAVAFSAHWRGSPTAPRSLAEVAADAGQSGFLRASALAQLPPAPAGEIRQSIQRAAGDADGLVRLGAARALAAYPPEEQLLLGADRLLDDSLRAVRVETARALAGIAEARLTPAQQRSFKAALAELRAVEQAAAERPESHVNLAQIAARLGRPAEAENALRTALRLDPRFIPAYINLADLYRSLGRDADGEKLLEQASRLAPEDAAPRHALALQRIRQGNKAEAVTLLRRAATLEPANGQYAYLLALALSETGAGTEALGVVDQARRKLPDDAALRQLQISLERRHGRIPDAVRHAAELQAIQSR